VLEETGRSHGWFPTITGLSKIASPTTPFLSAKPLEIAEHDEKAANNRV
jgi:hypothetical protein